MAGGDQSYAGGRQSSAVVFETHASRYDEWYDREPGRSLFHLELECLRALVIPSPRPLLEIGVGSGRFAEGLGIPYGVDPATSMLRIARSRVVNSIRGVAERLPIKSSSIGTAVLVATLCFVEDAALALQECFRILRPGGAVVLGLIADGTSWADYYTARAASSPFYRCARFYAKEVVERYLFDAGFGRPEYLSTLRQPPGLEMYEAETAAPGFSREAGFCCLRAPKTDPKVSQD